MEEKCLFCRMINGEIGTDKIYEDENFLAIKDIEPKAPIHFLIIPKKHIVSVNDLRNDLKMGDKKLIGELILIAQKIAQNTGTLRDGYRLVINTGKNAGQTIPHLHLHLMGGKKLLWY